jgi:DNA modification methylase
MSNQNKKECPECGKKYINLGAHIKKHDNESEIRKKMNNDIEDQDNKEDKEFGELYGEKYEKVSKNGLDMGERGKYDMRNPLNDLTGKEWIHFLNSVHETDFAADDDELELWKYMQDAIIDTRYSTNGEESYGHEQRKEHPAPKPPQLMRDLIEFFTKKNEQILDPFMGVGGTLLGAAQINRSAVGIELSKKFIDIYKDVSKKLDLELQTALEGDARELSEMEEVKEKEFDAIITDPPYADMMKKEKTGGDKTKEVGSNNPFTASEKDIGNLEYNEFLPLKRGWLYGCLHKRYATNKR